MARPTTPLNLTPAQNEYLQNVVRSREVPHSRVQRAQIIRLAAARDSNKKISQELGLCFDARWSLETALDRRSHKFINQQQSEKIYSDSNGLTFPTASWNTPPIQC
jgi:hypothetical protein